MILLELRLSHVLFSTQQLIFRLFFLRRGLKTDCGLILPLNLTTIKHAIKHNLARVVSICICVTIYIQWKTFVDFKQHISSIVMLTAKVCSKALQQMTYHVYCVVIVEISISPCWMTFIFLTSDFSFQLHIWKNWQLLCLWSTFFVQPLRNH